MTPSPSPTPQPQPQLPACTPTTLHLTVVTLDGGRSLTLTKDELEGEINFSHFIRCIIYLITVAQVRTILSHTLQKCAHHLFAEGLITLATTAWRQTDRQGEIKAKEGRRDSEMWELRNNKVGTYILYLRVNVSGMLVFALFCTIHSLHLFYQAPAGALQHCRFQHSKISLLMPSLLFILPLKICVCTTLILAEISKCCLNNNLQMKTSKYHQTNN